MHGERRVREASRGGWIRRITTTARPKVPLQVLAGCGREALGMDRTYTPSPEAVAQGLARRLARDLLRDEGWRSSDADAPIPFPTPRPSERPYWRQETNGSTHSCQVLATPWDPPGGTISAALARLDRHEDSLFVFAWDAAAVRGALEGQERVHVQPWLMAASVLSTPMRDALWRLRDAYAPLEETA